MRKKFYGLAVGAVALSAFVCASQAEAASTTYVLHDHGYGALGPDYGLRMDGIQPPLGDGPTFSVSTNGAYVTLVWDDVANTAVISGQVWNNTEGELWEVIYELENTQTVAGPNGGFEVVSATGSGSGVLVDPGSGFPTSYQLTGKANSDGLIFALLADGHRIPGDDTTLVAIGWIEGTGNYNDWLVTAEPVPLPAALPLFMTALAGLGVLRSRTRKQA